MMTQTRVGFARLILLACLLGPSLSKNAWAQSGQRKLDVLAYALHLDEFELPNGQTVEYSTSNTIAADPVMHLLQWSGSSWVHVTSNDNYSGIEARIQHTNTSGSVKRYLIVLRTINGVLGFTDVLRNGVLRTSFAPVMGQVIPASALGFLPNDEIRTNHRPGQSVAHALFSLTTTNGLVVGQFGMMNTPGGAARISVTFPGIDKSFVVGTPWVQTAQGYSTPRAGRAFLYSNDYYHDPDEDGVGTLLEIALGTCPASPCQHGYLPNDTDRDGLKDGEELWGVKGLYPSGADDIVFARWGANPLKKDVFVEVDWIHNFGTAVPDYYLGYGTPLGTNPFEYLGASWTLNWVNEVRAPLGAAPAAHIKNPDGTSGLSLHLDLGVSPTHPMNEDRYGAYGTASSPCVVRDRLVLLKESLSNGSIQLEINASTGAMVDVAGLTPQLALFKLLWYGWPSGVPTEQLRGFENIPGTPSWRIRLKTLVPCTSPNVSLGYSGTDASFADKIEVGFEPYEDLKWRNRSPYSDVDAVRRTRFRYVVLTPTAQAKEDNFVSNLDTKTFVHEFGHTLGLAHWGRNEWAPAFDPITNIGQSGLTCLPHYRSIMSYAYERPPGLPIRFAQEDGLLFNPARVDETQPFGSAGIGLPPFNVDGNWSFTGVPWNYGASATSIDFNRNLTFQSSSLWRTFGLAANNGQCHAFTAGKQVLGTSPVRGSVDLVKVSSRLFAFWLEADGLYSRNAIVGEQGDKSCTGDDSGKAPSSSCLTWAAPVQVQSGNDYVGVSVLRFGSQIFVALTKTNHYIEVRRYNVSGGSLTGVTPSWNLSNPGSPTTRTRLAPKLTLLHSVNHSGRLALIHRSESNNTFQMHTYNPGPGTWSSPVPLLRSSGTALMGGQAAGALVWPGQEIDMSSWGNAERRTLLVLPTTLIPDIGFACRLFILRPTGGADVWDEVSGWDSGLCHSQPSLALRTLRSTSGVPSTDMSSHIMLIHASSFAQHLTPQVSFSKLISRGNPPTSSGFQPIQMGWWGEKWTALAPGSNLSVYRDSTLDNVFGLGGMLEGGPNPVFYPHGDGAPSYVYGANSDFRVMEDEVCRRLRYSGPVGISDANAVCLPFVIP